MYMIDALFKPVVFTVFVVEDGNILLLVVLSDKMVEVIILFYVIYIYSKEPVTFDR